MNLSTSSFRKWVCIWGVTFTAFVGLAGATTEWLIRTKVEPNDIFLKHIEFFRTSTQQNVAIGDSIVALGFTGQKGYSNIAYPSETIEIAEQKLRIYFSSRKMQHVILQADIHQFCKHRVNRAAKSRTATYENLRWVRMFSPVHRTQWLLYWRTYFGKGYFKPKFAFQPDGAQTLSGTINGAEDNPSSVCDPIKNIYQSRIAKSYLAIANFVKAKGGQLCLVRFPKSHERRKLIRARAGYKAVEIWFQKFAREQKVKFIDLLDLVENDDLFNDHDHLNHRGALTVSPKIKDACSS